MGETDSKALDEQDRRTTPRPRQIKTGKIVYEHASCTMDCVVLDLTDGGASILPDDILNCPKIFELQVRFGPTRQCEVVWQRGEKMGLKFID